MQVLVALGALGISTEDARFIKNGNSLLDNLLSFANPEGSYRHATDSSGNSRMSTEQAFYGLVAVWRAETGANRLYDMSDAEKRSETSPEAGIGLAGKHAEVQVAVVLFPGKSFSDVAGHPNQTTIEALAVRGIINGKAAALFDPETTMTRAEFAAIVVRTLGLREQAESSFADVPADAWYAGYVATAHGYDIINGVSPSEFNPLAMISKQEAAVMLTRAAELAGMDTAMEAAAVRDALAPFGDYVTAAGWARESLACCYSAGLFDDTDFNIEPERAILRREIAQALYNLLEQADLLG